MRGNAVAGSTIESAIQAPTSAAGNLLTLKVRLVSAPGSGKSLRFQISINGTPSTTMDVTVSDAATSGTATGTVALSANDLLTIKVTPSGTPTLSLAEVQVEFDPTTANNYTYPSNSTDSGTAAPRYLPGMLGSFTQQSTDSLANQTRDVIPFAGTLTAVTYYIGLNAPGVGKSWDLVIMVNGSEQATTAANISGTNRIGSATGLSISLAAGDLLTFKVKAANGGPASARFGWAMTIVPTTSGLFALNAVSANSFSSSQFLAETGAGVAAANATEATVQVFTAPAALHLVALYVVANAAAGSGKTRTYQQRVNTGNGNMVATISGVSDTAGSDTGHTDAVSAGDVLDIAYTNTASTTASTGNAWAVAATTAPGSMFIDLAPVDVEVDVPALTLHQPIAVHLDPADVEVEIPEVLRIGGIPLSLLLEPVDVEVDVPGFASIVESRHFDLAPVDVEVDILPFLITQPRPEGQGGGGGTGITVYSPDGTLIASSRLVVDWKTGRHLNSVGDWEMTIPALEPLVNGVPLASLLRTGWLVDIRHEGSRVYDRLDRPHLMYHGEIEDADFDVDTDGALIANITGSFRTIRLGSRATPTSAQYENVPMSEVAADIEGGLCDGIIVPVNATRTIGLGFNNDNGNAILTMYARLLRLGEYARWYLRESWDRDRPQFIPQDACPNSGYVLTNVEAVGDAAYLAGRKGIGIITGQPKVRREGRGVYNRILGFSTGRKMSVDSISRAGTLVMTEQPIPGSTLTIEGRDYTFTNGLLSYNDTTKMALVPVGSTVSEAIGLLRSAISEGLSPIPPHQRISIGLVESDGGDGFEAPIYWRGVSRESNAIDFSGDAFGDSDSSANYIDSGSADPAVAQESSYALTVSAATNSVPYAPQEGTNPDGTKYNYIEDQESIDLYGLRETMMNRQDIRAADSTAEAQAAAANVLLLTMYSELLKVKSPKIFVDLEGLGADIWALPGDRLYVRYTGSVLLNGSRVTQMDLTGWWMVTDREDAVSDPTGVRRVNLTLAAPEISIQIPELLDSLGLGGGGDHGEHGSLTTGLSPVPGEGIEGGPEAPDETFPIPTPSPLPPILSGPLPAPNPGAGPFGGNGGGALWPNCCPDPTTRITSIGTPTPGAPCVPAFEDWSQDYRGFETGSGTTSTFEVQEDGSARYEAIGTNPSLAAFYQCDPMEDGETYQLSFEYKGTVSPTDDMEVFAIGELSAPFGSRFTLVPAEDWTPVTLTFTREEYLDPASLPVGPDGADNPHITFGAVNPLADTILIDIYVRNFAITKVDES